MLTTARLFSAATRINKSMVSPMISKFMGDYGYSAKDVPADLSGKQIFITGGTNGIGLSYARTLYTRGASLHIISQTAEVGNAAEAYITTGDIHTAPKDYQEGFGSGTDTSGEGGSKTGSVQLYNCELADLNDVAKTAKEIKDKVDRLDIFAAIAGVGVNSFTRTKDGYDSHLTINCLSHHLFLSHFFPIMKETASQPGADIRIVNMASESHRHDIGGPSEYLGGDRFRTKEEFKRDVGPAGLYGRSKIGNILFTRAVTQRHAASTPIHVFATHPGVVATGQQDQFKPAYGEVAGAILGAVVRPLARRPDQGASSILWASCAEDAKDEASYPNGSYFSDPKTLGGESNEGKDQELIDNFYKTSEEVIKEIVGEKNMGSW